MKKHKIVSIFIFSFFFITQTLVSKQCNACDPRNIFQYLAGWYISLNDWCTANQVKNKELRQKISTKALSDFLDYLNHGYSSLKELGFEFPRDICVEAPIPNFKVKVPEYSSLYKDHGVAYIMHTVAIDPNDIGSRRLPEKIVCTLMDSNEKKIKNHHPFYNYNHSINRASLVSTFYDCLFHTLPYEEYEKWEKKDADHLRELYKLCKSF
jgi:hypothetical protein